MFYALPSLECVRCIFEINVGLLLTADNSVPVSPGVGMVPKWIGTVADRVDPPKVLLK